MYKLNVYLSDIPDKKINDIKNFYVNVTEESEIKKLKNILKLYKTQEKLSIPIKIDNDGIEIRISTRKLSNHISSPFSELEPIKWNGYTADIYFKIQKYHFKNQDPSKGEIGFTINGIMFMLQNLKL